MARRILVPLALLCAAFTPAAGQTLPKLPGAVGSVLKGGLPDVSSMGLSNAAGVLGYCMKNKYLHGTDATSVLGGLMKKPGVESSSGYTQGSAGKIITSSGPPVSLQSLSGELKSQACKMVLKQGAKLL